MIQSQAPPLKATSGRLRGAAEAMQCTVRGRAGQSGRCGKILPLVEGYNGTLQLSLATHGTHGLSASELSRYHSFPAAI
jgi:hypothetical protein